MMARVQNREWREYTLTVRYWRGGIRFDLGEQARVRHPDDGTALGAFWETCEEIGDAALATRVEGIVSCGSREIGTLKVRR